MKHRAFICGKEVCAEHDFIAYGPVSGKIAECSELNEAHRAFERKRSEDNEHNVVTDVALFQWSSGHWSPAVSLYELQEEALRSNPSRCIRYP